MKTLIEDSFEDEPLDPYGVYRVEYTSLMSRICTGLRRAGQFTGRKS